MTLPCGALLIHDDHVCVIRMGENYLAQLLIRGNTISSVRGDGAERILHRLTTTLSGTNEAA